MPAPLGFGILRGAAGLGLMRGGGRRTYTDKIKDTQKANLIGYWPLDGNAYDVSGNGFHGTPTAITYGDGPATGQQAAVFDGATSYINLIGAGLAAAFNGAEGTLFAWFKVSGAGDWADATGRHIFNFYVDASNLVEFYKRTAAGQVARVYVAGGTANINNLAMDPVNPTGWCWGACTWNKAQDRVMFYLIGAAAPVTKTTLGIWAGSITKALIGTNAVAAGSQFWKGSLAHVALWNTELTAAQITALVVTTPPF